MSANFLETEHPRAETGRFTDKRNSAPTGALRIEPSSALQLATRAKHEAEQLETREIVREMRRTAPDRANALVFELYNDGDLDAEVFAFQFAVDDDGDELPISRETNDYLWELSNRLDATTAEDFGLERHGDVFTLPIAVPNTAESAQQALADSIALHRSAVTAHESLRTSKNVSEAAHRRLTQIIKPVPGHRTPTALLLTPDDGAGTGLVLERAELNGRETTDDFGSAGIDDATWDDINDAAAYIHPHHVEDLDGLTDLSGSGHGPFRMRVSS